MSGAAGTSMGGGANELAEFTGATGLPCAVDGDCFGGLTCIPSTAATNPFGDGGPQRGVCTATCTGDAAGSATCTSVDSFSDCIVFEGVGGFCWPLCPLGIANAQRCTGRRDLGCSNTLNDPEVGICRPQCSSDVECGDRFCDLGTGFCVDALPVRGPGEIGAACNLATELTDCVSGFCLDIEADGSGFCTAPCVIGSVAGCGFSADASPREAACFSLSQTSVLGDRGLCLELCDADADCAQAGSGYTCAPQEPAAQQGLGRVGQCVPPLAGADAGVDGG